MPIAYMNSGPHLLAYYVFAILFVFLPACSRSAGSSLLTPEEFTKEVAIALQARTPSDVAVSVPKDLEISMATKAYPKISCDLDRAYADYQRDPSHKSDIIERWIVGSLEMATSKPAAIDASRIVPLVRNRAYLKNTTDALSERGMKGDPDFVYDDLNSDLIVLYAKTTDNTFYFLHPGDLQDARIDRKDLKKLDCANLSHMIPRILSSGGKGINIFMADSDLGASLLLLDSFWNKDQMKVKGDIVVGVPESDCLIVTGSNDPECLKIARNTVAQTYAKASRPICDKLFVLRNGHFSEFTETPIAGTQPK